MGKMNQRRVRLECMPEGTRVLESTLGVLGSAHDLIDKAQRANRYEEMLKLNRLTLKSWLGRIEYVGHRLGIFDYQHVLISSSWPRLILFVTLVTIFFLLVFTVLFFYVEKKCVKTFLMHGI